MKLPKSFREQKEGILDKKYSHVELLESYITRIKTFDKKYNSFITLDEESAYKKAKECDRIFSELGNEVYDKYCLFGVVTGLKDLFCTKDLRTTAGSNLLSNFISPYNATVVDKLINAGAIIIGKTNCDAWAHGASGENSDYGPSKNPWNTDFVPGGSSSGSAVALASDFCLLSTGTDTGGSIRQPANFCGVVGLKPSYGAVSRYGIIAMSSTFDSIGHFTNCIEDSETVFNVTKGLDPLDATSSDGKKNFLKKKYRLGVPKEYFNEGLDEDVKKEIQRVLNNFEKMGFELLEISLPMTKYAISVYYIIQPAEVSSNLGRFDGIRYGKTRNTFGNEAKRRIILGTFVLSSGYYDQYYIKAMKVRNRIIGEFEKAFTQVDAIVAPVSPTQPFKLGEKINDPLKMYLADIYTVAANIAGIPGLAIPSNYSSSGMPLGFQLLGNKFSEDILFDIGKQFEKSNDIEKNSPILT